MLYGTYFNTVFPKGSVTEKSTKHHNIVDFFNKFHFSGLKY